MTHREFIRHVAARKGVIIHALVKAALPPGALYAVFTTLEKSDDPSEEALAAVVTNLDRAGVLQLLERYQRSGEPLG